MWTLARLQLWIGEYEEIVENKTEMLEEEFHSTGDRANTNRYLLGSHFRLNFRKCFLSLREKIIPVSRPGKLECLFR